MWMIWVQLVIVGVKMCWWWQILAYFTKGGVWWCRLLQAIVWLQSALLASGAIRPISKIQSNSSIKSGWVTSSISLTDTRKFALYTARRGISNEKYKMIVEMYEGVPQSLRTAVVPQSLRTPVWFGGWLIDWVNVACISFPFFLENHLNFGLHFWFYTKADY